MLSSILNSKRAIQVNIAIMRVFVRLKQMISTHKELAHKLDLLEERVERHDEAIRGIFDAIRELMTTPRKTQEKNRFPQKLTYPNPRT